MVEPQSSKLITRVRFSSPALLAVGAEPPDPPVRWSRLASSRSAYEFDIDEPLIGRLIGNQSPKWAGLPITKVRSAGTDNAIYRLGAARSVP
jgi:hypothetical protein